MRTCSLLGEFSALAEQVHSFICGESARYFKVIA
jgi:hypothetical protein